MARAGVSQKDALTLTEGVFALLLEHGGDGLPGAAGDLVVDVNEPPPQQPGNGLADAGLAGAGEACEEDVGEMSSHMAIFPTQPALMVLD